MQYDLIIRNGTVIDGSGLPRFRADVGITGGKIASIGKIRESAKEVIDADGHIVAPGFIDAHTHMDAQVFWDPIGTCSCWHGITSVVMGNCGFSLAPCGEKDKLLVMRNLERAEDIAPEAMEAGIKWSWTTFPEYLDAVDTLPKGINYAAYMGHSALRTYVMGQRAFEEEATAEDLTLMKTRCARAIGAGADRLHYLAHAQPSDARWPSGRQPPRELERSARAGRRDGRDECRASSKSPVKIPASRATGVTRLSRPPQVTRRRYFCVPVTFGMFSTRRAPDYWRNYFRLADETAAEGGRMFIQVHSRSLNVLLSFETNMPFDKLPLWRELRKRPLAEQEAALRDPEKRRALVAAAHERIEGRPVGPEARNANYKWLFPLDRATPPYRSIAEIADASGKDPVDVVIDLALEKHLKQFFLQTLINENQDHVLEMMKHPRSVVTFSDSGAHVSQIMDSSLQTHVLSYWVREKQALTLEQAVRSLSFVPAYHWGLTGRGLLREGYNADVVVFDPDRVAPRIPELTYDLPAGARRLKQKADGIMTTVVNGQVLLRNNEHTGALPGKLLRGPLARSV